MKRMFKFFLSVCALFAVLTVFCNAQVDSNLEILPNREITVEIEDGNSKAVKFVPLFSGRYRIESISEYDLTGQVFDEEMNKLMTDYDSGYFSDFAIEMDFEEGKCYYITVSSKVDRKISCKLLLTVLKVSASHEHKFDLEKTEEATCTQYGKKIFSCVCGMVKTEIVDKAEHNYISEKIEPTCTSKGQCKQICTKCGDVQITAINALGHELGDKFTVDKAPTCTAQGSKSIHCKRCGKSFETTAIMPTGHSFGSWQVITKPTCEKTGKNERFCKTCLKKETALTKALGHKISSAFTVDKAATCTARGSKSRHCQRCSKKFEVTVVSALGHSYSSKWTVDKKSGFTASGSKSHHCIRCSSKANTTLIPKVETALLSKVSFVYDTKEKKPTVSLRDTKGNKLKYKTDYTLNIPKTPKAIGEYTVTVLLKGNYEGKKTLKYRIVPGDVSDFTVKTDTASAKLSWKAVKGAEKYRVYLYNKEKKEYKLLLETKKAGCKVEKLKSGTTYIFVVKALKTVGSKTFCSAKLTYKECSTYPVKTKLSAKVSGRQTKLSWKKVNCTGYLIYSSETKNGSFKQIKNIKGAEITSYTKTNLAKGKTYYFKIRSYKTIKDKVLYSPYSESVAVKIR